MAVSTKVYDPRTSLRVWPHHKDPDEQCAVIDCGYFCTVKAGHDGWHAAYGSAPEKGTLHIWLDQEPTVRTATIPDRQETP